MLFKFYHRVHIVKHGYAPFVLEIKVQHALAQLDLEIGPVPAD